MSLAALFPFDTAVAADTTRFTGSGALSAPNAQSSDGRFRIDAELQAAPASKQGGRFTLDARLKPAATSIETACGLNASDIFKNGFE